MMNMNIEELMEEVEKKGLMDTPYKDLTPEEKDMVKIVSTIRDIMEDSEFKNAISLRDYCYPFEDYTPSKLFALIKPYLPFINEELAKKGFVRVSKYTWRKLAITVDEKKLEELAKKLKLSEDEAYILAVAYKLLKITIPFQKDWRGYNVVDGFRILDIFEKIKEGEITKKDIEYIRQKLLKYEEQIKGLGLDFERIKGDENGRE